MNKYIKIFYFCISCILFFSCKKIYNNSDTNQIFTVEMAKEYVNSHFSVNEFYSKSSAVYSFKTKRGSINWKLAQSFEDSNYSFIQIPLENDGKISLNNHSTTLVERHNAVSNLLVFKEKNGINIYTAIMTAVSDDNDIDLGNIRYKSLPDNFSGKVIFTDWYGNFINGWEYDNGLAKRSMAISKELTKQKSEVQPNYASGCEEIIVDTWERWCTPNGECSAWELVGSNTYLICDGDGGSGGSVYITNITSNQPDNITPDTSIINNLIANCVYQKLMNSNMQNGLKKILSAFNDNNCYNVQFKLDDLSGTGYDGTTHYDGFTNGAYNFTIKINSADALDPNFSRVWLASTFIHEAFHAKLRQKALEVFGTSVISTWPKAIDDMDLAELERYFQIEAQKSNYWEAIGHDWMINHINTLAESIREYVQVNYPSGYSQIGSNLDKYKGLAYKGLEETSLYQTEVIDKGLESVYNTYNAALVSGYNVCNELILVE